MATIFQRLPAFALPFVTRSLRGGRGRRFAALSLGLAVLTLMMSLWIGLGRGDGARDARVSIGMEQAPYFREHQEFVVIRGARETAESVTMRQTMHAGQGHALLRGTLGGDLGRLDDDQRQLQARARALANQLPDTDRMVAMDWQNPREVERLANVVDRRGVPAIIDYESPIGLYATLELLAIVSGGLLVVLLTIVAPLLVGLQQAAERHENTLQPLTGTALSGRELAIGLACGPLAIVAMFAIPIAGLFLAATLVIGKFGALLILVVLAGTGFGLVFGVQLLAHLSGASRTPGMIAVGLLALLGMIEAFGLGIATGSEPDMLGLPALLPQTGLFALLGECFGDPWRQVQALQHLQPRFRAGLGEIVGPSLIGMVGAALLGGLALRALTRHIEGRHTLLEASHALVGALICIVMLNAAIPVLDRHEPFHQALGLPLLSLPFMLLIMARVPIGDMPTSLRRIPLLRLLGEFASWVALEVIVAAVIDGTLAGLHPIALLGVGWSVLVLVLIAIRLAATPGQILSHVWVLVCLGMLPFTFGFAMACGFASNQAVEMLGESVFLSFSWLVMVVWVPVSLIRHLRRHVAAID